MKKPIEPTAHMVRLAKRWRRECAAIDRLSEQGGGPCEARRQDLLAKHEQTSHELAHVAAAALILYGWVPLATSTARARKKR